VDALQICQSTAYPYNIILDGQEKIMLLFDPAPGIALDDFIKENVVRMTEGEIEKNFSAIGKTMGRFHNYNAQHCCPVKT